jgi:hypothetical protein
VDPLSTKIDVNREVIHQPSITKKDQANSEKRGQMNNNRLIMIENAEQVA